MTKQIALLIELQRLDSLIIDKDSRIGLIPERVSLMERPLNDAQSSLAMERQRLDSAEKKKREKERALEEMNERVKKLKARTSEIKTNKEYQAHLKEIEAVEKEVLGIEDEILTLMEEIDAKKAMVRSAEKMLNEEQRKIDAIKAELEDEVKREGKELQGLRLKRAEAIKSIEADLYSLYMSLLESQKGIAVALAKDEICHGCNMNIPPQLFVEIKKNEDIIQCPQCKRILYYHEEKSAEKSNPLL